MQKYKEKLSYSRTLGYSKQTYSRNISLYSLSLLISKLYEALLQRKVKIKLEHQIYGCPQFTFT